MADDLDALYDQYGEETVRKAFWLQQRIFTEGVEAVNFSTVAEEKMNKTGPLLVSKAIRDELPDSL